MRRLFPFLNIVALLGLAGALYAMICAHPPMGSVTGVITDSATGQPIVKAWVRLTKTETTPSAEAPEESTAEVNDPMGGTAAPYGWAQGSRSDKSDTPAQFFSGGEQELAATTDSEGRYTISGVPQGDYTISATADGYDYQPESESVYVAEDQPSPYSAKLTATAPSLNFDQTNTAWLPDEDTVIGLNGTLRTPDVQLTLDRVDTADAIAHAPQMLSGGAYENGETPKEWPGEFHPVRSWPLKRKSSTTRSLFERVHLGKLPVGVYRITAKNMDTQASGWILVSDLALVRKAYGNHALAFVCDLKTGKAVPGAALTLYQDKANALQSAVTGPDGLATLSTAGAIKESKGILVASRNSSAAAVTLQMNGVNEGQGAPDAGSEDGSVAASPGALRSFIYTDRPVYRPGQTISFKGILRRFNLGAHGLQVPSGEAVSLDIRDPQDTLVSHQDLTTNDMGSWNGTVTLTPEALTGEYTLAATIGGQKANGSFVVAVYRKPQYKVKVAFDKTRYVRGDTLAATISATYYFGAPVAAAKVHYSVMESGDTVTDNSPWFGREGGNSDASDEPSHSGQDNQDGDIRLDDHGQAIVRVPTHTQKDNSQDTDYEISVSVEDPSGKSVDESASVTVGQGEFSLDTDVSQDYVSPGQSVAATIRAANPAPSGSQSTDTQPRAGQTVHVVIGYQEWDGDQEIVKSPQAQDVVTGANGDVTLTVPAPKAGLLSIRASAVDARGNGIESEQSVWVSSGDSDISMHYPDLSVVLDKEKYRSGDTANVLINAEQTGPTALVTVEGATLYRSWTVPLAHNSTSLKIPVTSDYAPGVTISVCCVSSKQFLTSQQRMSVDDPGRHLQVKVEGDVAKYGPGDAATITVHTSDQDGKPKAAEVSVGVVDSSIYAIRPEPDGTIEDAFLPDQGQAVDTEYSCAYRYVGDVDKGAMGVKLRHNFPDTALWQPVVKTDATGTAQVRFHFPDNLTTWRVTCYGHTQDTAVGKGTAELLVSKALVAHLEAPSFLTIGDQATIAAVVTNNGPAAIDTQVQLTTSSPGGEVVAIANADAPCSLHVESGASERVEWPVDTSVAKNAQLSTASDGAGGTTLTGPLAPVDFKLAVKTPGGLADGVLQTIPVKPRTALRDTWQAGSILSDVENTMTLASNTVPGATTLRVHISPTVSSALIPALDYLGGYPYETTDSAASMLIADSILATASAGTAPAIPLSAARRRTLPDEIDRCERRLYRYQADDGAWGWCVGNKPDLWMTAYAVWALGRAKQAGYAGNTQAYDNGLTKLAELAQDRSTAFGYGDGELSPEVFAALALSEGGHSDDAKKALALTELHWRNEPKDMRYADMAVAALVYDSLDAAGKQRGAALMGQIWAGRMRMAALSAWQTAPSSIAPGAEQYAPDVAATAWVLVAAQQIAPADPQIDPVALWLMERRSGDHWGAPNTTALTVMALTKYMARSHEMQPNFDAVVDVNGQRFKAAHFGAEAIDRPDLIVDIPTSALKAGKNTVHIGKTGPGRLYYSLDLREGLLAGPPAVAPSYLQHVSMRLFHPERLEPPFAPSGFRIKRIYLRTTSRRSFFWEDTVPAPGMDYRKDDTILVRLIIDNTRPGSHLIVEEPVPAGCAITDVSGDQSDDWANWWNYTDVRDDKLVFLVGEMPRGRHEIDYHLRAQTVGSFDAMPTHVTGTFDPTLQALGNVARVTVE